MTTLTKTEAEAILERLADKTLSFGCKVKNKCFGYERIVAFSDDKGSYGGSVAYVPKPDEYVTGDQMDSYKDGKFEILGHSILIGDVLEKLKAMDMEPSYDLLHVWDKLSFTLSLQEIFNRIEWELDEYYSETQNQGKCVTEKERDAYRLAKPSPFADLFIYLKEIGL